MAIIKIVREGEPVLRKKCRPVENITPRILQLLDDMADTLHEAGGVGLAAPQVGVLRRIVIVEPTPGELIELINPEIISESGEQHNLEGCLSIPGEWGITCRPAKVKVRASDRNGKLFTAAGEDLAARAFCHEIDHLDGILFKDHAEMLSEEEIKETFGEDS